MINDLSIQKILFGGDYNPEQWDRDTWKEDMRLLALAHIDTVTLNVFSWGLLQPSENEYTFSQLDEIIDTVSSAGMNICLATATAAHPAWMARKYPDILRVNIDGIKRQFGCRHNSCPNSPTYRLYSVRLAAKLAERYGKNPHIKAWHVSNEYGDTCYCENCAKAFRVWLQEKYKTISTLNDAWNTAFWGHTYYSWDDIVVPSHISEQWQWNKTASGPQSLDYKRFNSDSLLACYTLERDTLRSITPHIPITTNLMGTYRELDYHKWGKELDFISWDNYPSPDQPFTRTAFSHALMRGCKPGKPFVLMEQTPSVTNWQPYNALKRPGVMRLISCQALAHGSDTVMFFQMRRSRGCCEKYHGAVIDHCGHENTRVFREISQLGSELEHIGSEFLGSLVESQAGVLFDWDNYWATGFSAGPTTELEYVEEVFKYYDAFAAKNYSIDVIAHDADFSPYRVIAAPLLYMVKPGIAEKLEEFVTNGGILITTFLSGYVDETDLVVCGGYPGKLRNLAGIWVEEIDALLPGTKNGFVFSDETSIGSEKTFPAVMLCDIIHPETAQTLAVYESDFYAGTPAVTRNVFGKGEVWYIGASTPKNGTMLAEIASSLCRKAGIEPLASPVSGIEVTRRVKRTNGCIEQCSPDAACASAAVSDRMNGNSPAPQTASEPGSAEFYFILNHNTAAAYAVMPEDGIDILTGTKYTAGEAAVMQSTGVIILKKTR